MRLLYIVWLGLVSTMSVLDGLGSHDSIILMVREEQSQVLTFLSKLSRLGEQLEWVGKLGAKFWSIVRFVWLHEALWILRIHTWLYFKGASIYQLGKFTTIHQNCTDWSEQNEWRIEFQKFERVFLYQYGGNIDHFVKLYSVFFVLSCHECSWKIQT